MSQFEDIWERFWSKVEVGKEDDCWEWLGAKNSYGYGSIYIHGQRKKAHRIGWRLQEGDIPKKKQVLHSCDNPPCINSHHLFLGTQQDNAIDRETKHRGNHPRGEKNGRSKLTAEKVVEIRAIYLTGVAGHYMLAEMFGVKKSTIDSLLSRRSWRHI